MRLLSLDCLCCLRWGRSNDKIEEDYDIALNDELTVDQDQELEKRLQQTLYQFLKEHHLDKRVWTVFSSMKYRPEDFGIDLSDF